MSMNQSIKICCDKKLHYWIGRLEEHTVSPSIKSSIIYLGWKLLETNIIIVLDIPIRHIMTIRFLDCSIVHSLVHHHSTRRIKWQYRQSRQRWQQSDKNRSFYGARSLNDSIDDWFQFNWTRLDSNKWETRLPPTEYFVMLWWQYVCVVVEKSIQLITSWFWTR